MVEAACRQPRKGVRRRRWRDEKEYSSQQEVSHSEDETTTSAQQAEEFFKKAEAPLEADQSVEEKIKKIVVENPEVSSIKVMRQLNTPQYGNLKLGYFQILKYLKRLNLNSKKKRVEFFKKMNIA